MIDFYTFRTSNALRVGIMLEECGLAYRRHVVDLSKGEQRQPAFLAINPAGAVPAIVDTDAAGGPLVIAQSGAILLHYALSTGRFLPQDASRRAMALQWLMIATTDCGPSGTMAYFMNAVVPDKSPANVEFFRERMLRYLRMADERLRGREFLADELSIADFALYPIVAVNSASVEKAAPMPDLARWVAALAARPAVARAMGAGS